MKHWAIILCLFAVYFSAHGQQPLVVKTDSLNQPEAVVKTVLADSASRRSPHSPRKATFRSAVLPGWGQAYNREYWKIPIVYGALSIPAITWSFNNTWYRRTRDAFDIRANADTGRFDQIHPKLTRLDAGSLLRYRNQYRRDRDYSVLWFFILWGVQVADATVFAHLKDFDVGDDLSLKISPHFSPQGAPQLRLALGYRNEKSTLRKTGL